MSVVCSPLYRCFPPEPTVCFICGREDGSRCIFKVSDTPHSGPEEIAGHTSKSLQQFGAIGRSRPNNRKDSQ